MRYKDKVVVITGAGSGIGRAMALQFAAEEASVVAADTDLQRLTQIEAQIKKSGGQITTAQVDVAIRTQMEQFLADVLKQQQQIDVLCNNAGVADRLTPLADVDDAFWQHVLGVNLHGPMFASRYILPHMVARRKGVILNTASLAGLTGDRAGAPYTVSKHALIGLTRHIGWQYGPQGIRCIALCPGMVETQLGKGEGQHPLGWQRLEPLLATMPPVGTAEDIAHLACFLASDEAHFVNGTTLIADGGWSAL